MKNVLDQKRAPNDKRWWALESRAINAPNVWLARAGGCGAPYTPAVVLSVPLPTMTTRRWRDIAGKPIFIYCQLFCTAYNIVELCLFGLTRSPLEVRRLIAQLSSVDGYSQTRSVCVCWCVDLNVWECASVFLLLQIIIITIIEFRNSEISTFIDMLTKSAAIHIFYNNNNTVRRVRTRSHPKFVCAVHAIKQHAHHCVIASCGWTFHRNCCRSLGDLDGIWIVFSLSRVTFFCCCRDPFGSYTICRIQVPFIV